MKQDNAKQPDITVLARYVRGDKELMTYWSQFIEQDPECREKVALLERLHRMLNTLDLKRMAVESNTLAQSIFRSYAATRESSSGCVAHLYYDSRVVPLPEGVRPSLMSLRRLKFMAGDGKIELSISPVYPGRYEITGRYEGPLSCESGEAIIQGRRAQRAPFDRFGFFFLAAVDPGVYHLSCRVADQKYVIPALEL